ncbi:unnamed protein product [Symbiodinium necroappetens]|uniref:Uncharacterized protein n=1 Tax=Symbiodinium necroappetens TaxID=1628268 RepID=A0A812ZB78_9DINO|nr:unnamed protein product [Symbiodinium necroappetens]
MVGCDRVPGEAWAELRAAEWPELGKASFVTAGPRCFQSSGEGSEELLAALGRSQQLEEVDFDRCEKIPDAAWELLGDGAWPRLRVAKGIPNEHLERLREAPLDLEAGAGGWKCEKRRSAHWLWLWVPRRQSRDPAASSMELQEPGAKQLPMYPAFITSVLMPGNGGAAAVQRDLDLLPALARSDVEELNLDECRDVPAAVWQQLGQAQGEAFQKLRKASFAWCFDERSKGAESAAGLLLALSRCQLLQELGMAFCYKVPAAAWQLLATARWEQLRKADFYRCFGRASEGAARVGGLLSALARCRQLQDASAREFDSACSSKASDGAEDNQSDPAGQELLMGECHQISASAWQQLEGAQWPKLTKVDFGWCLGFWAPVGVCVVWSRSLLGFDGDVGVDEAAGTQPFHRSGLTKCRGVLSSEP